MILRKINNRLTSIISRQKWYDTYWGGVTKFWNISDFDIDVVNLGSNSGKYGFDYSHLDIKGMNWAIGPQSLVHDFNILKNYFSYLRENATVIISLCPFSSLVSSYSEYQNLKYYTFLHPATIIGFNEEERVKALEIKASPLVKTPVVCLKGMLKTLLRPIIKRNTAPIDYDNSAVSYIGMWKKQFSINDLDCSLPDRHIADQNNRTAVLNSMISFCMERGLKPVLVIPPMHHALASRLSPTFRENYIYSFIREANTADIPFYDYMDDRRFAGDKYFRDAFLMSEEGAKKFTETFLKDAGIL